MNVEIIGMHCFPQLPCPTLYPFCLFLYAPANMHSNQKKLILKEQPIERQDFWSWAEHKHSWHPSFGYQGLRKTLTQRNRWGGLLLWWRFLVFFFSFDFFLSRYVNIRKFWMTEQGTPGWRVTWMLYAHIWDVGWTLMSPLQVRGKLKDIRSSTGIKKSCLWI